LVDTNGLPVRLALTAGEAHDNRLADKLLSRLKSGSMLLADRGYNADLVRSLVAIFHDGSGVEFARITKYNCCLELAGNSSRTRVLLADERFVSGYGASAQKQASTARVARPLRGRSEDGTRKHTSCVGRTGD
jgi:hypothetical protein